MPHRKLSANHLVFESQPPPGARPSDKKQHSRENTPGNTVAIAAITMQILLGMIVIQYKDSWRHLERTLYTPGEHCVQV